MISDRKRIIKVMTAEKSPKYALPNTVVAFAPEPIAPTVCAIVFNVRIAARERSTFSCFNFLSNEARFGCFCSNPAINEGVILSRTASAIEQRNENTRAIKTYIASSTISIFEWAADVFFRG